MLTPGIRTMIRFEIEYKLNPAKMAEIMGITEEVYREITSGTTLLLEKDLEGLLYRIDEFAEQYAANNPEDFLP